MNSVPGLNEIAAPAPAASNEPQPQASATPATPAPEVQAPTPSQPTEEPPSAPMEKVITAKEDPRFDKFFCITRRAFSYLFLADMPSISRW